MTDPLGQSQVIPYLMELSKSGFEIHILSAEKPDRFNVRKNKIEDILKTANISWYPIFYTKKPPVISTLLDISKLKKKAKSLQKLHNFDIVHCRSYVASFVGIYMQKHYGTKYIFDMRGFYADERVDGNVWRLSNPVFRLVYNYFKHKEKEFLSNADYVVSLTAAAEKIIRQNKNFEKIPVKIIPCCADLEHFNYENIDISLQNKFKSELNIKENDFVIGYLGSVGTWYMLDEMLYFFKILKTKIQNAKFLFITKENHEEIIENAKKHGIAENSLILKAADREDVPTMISLMNYSIFFIMPVFSKKASSPTKFAELLGMGIPVIANAGVGDMDYYFSEYKCGIMLNDFSENEILNAVEKIQYDNFEKKNLRKISENNFSTKIGVERYYDIYKEMNCTLS